MSVVTVFIDDTEVDRLAAGHREWLITMFARRWAERRLGTRLIDVANANDPAVDGAAADRSPVQTKDRFDDSL